MEVLDVLHVDGGAAHVFDAAARGVEDVLDVLQRLRGLLARTLAGQFAGGRVDAQLAGDEHESVGLHGLAVGAECCRGFGGGHCF